MNATCDFTTDRRDDVLMVANEAVKQTDDGSTVTVLVGDKQITRQVETGLIGKDYTEIISGLKRGEKVITSIISPTAGSSFGSSGMSGRTPRMGGMGGPPP
jgi:multidrug efflux pump subunit AcrA (membrane-fusion protein)